LSLIFTSSAAGWRSVGGLSGWWLTGNGWTIVFLLIFFGWFDGSRNL
jgi:hypothetical protein